MSKIKTPTEYYVNGYNGLENKFEFAEAYSDYRMKAEEENHTYCPNCGTKKAFKVETDINSGKVCKNIMCR